MNEITQVKGKKKEGIAGLRMVDRNNWRGEYFNYATKEDKKAL